LESNTSTTSVKLHIIYIKHRAVHVWAYTLLVFSRRYMECQRGIATSVRLSVKRVHCDKTEEKSVQIFIPYERSFSLVF